MWFVFTGRAPIFFDPPMERLIAVAGDERCVEFGPSVEISTEKTTRFYEGMDFAGFPLIK